MNTELAQVYTDFSGLHAMRAQAREDQDAALETVSRQFESLFVQMMLKSMRKASFGGGLLDSQQSEFYRDMYDQQLGVSLSEQHGIGLAEMLQRQLGGDQLGDGRGRAVDDYLGHPVLRAQAIGASDGVAEPGSQFSGEPDEFIQALWPEASAAAERLGLPAEALVAQAALETGWGKHVMRSGRDGSSHNLFGIKADSRWNGERVNVSTLEYRDGVALKTRAAFRAYESFADSFADYVRFVGDNPRYAAAVAVSDDPKAYFRELQQAGYATDPAYADKIARILDSEPMRKVKHSAAKAGAI